MNNKQCQGCGALLQQDCPSKIGYSKDVHQNCCQRCFRLTHYNDAMYDFREEVDPQEILSLIQQEKNALFVYVIDVLSFEDFCQKNILQHLKNRHVAIIINKIDLLPKNANLQKVEEKMTNQLKYIFTNEILLEAAFLAKKDDNYFIELFHQFLQEKNFNRIIFIGSFNAGKSTLMNLLVGSKKLTTSIYPSTTLSVNTIEYNGRTYIDTPGSVHSGNLLMNLSMDVLKTFAVQKTMKPLVFQLHEDQSYVIEDIFRLDIKVTKPTSVIFYIAPEVKVHRTKLDRVEDYLHRHRQEFSYLCDKKNIFTFNHVSKKDFEIPGLGFVTIHQAKQAIFYVPNNTQVWKRKVLL